MSNFSFINTSLEFSKYILSRNFNTEKQTSLISVQNRYCICFFPFIKSIIFRKNVFINPANSHRINTEIGFLLQK